MDKINREMIEIELHPNISREDGFSLSRWWKPLICDLREWKQDLKKNMMPSNGPWKGPISLILHSLPSHLLCNLFAGSLLICTLFFPWLLSHWSLYLSLYSSNI
jgi:hypothetical protein